MGKITPISEMMFNKLDLGCGKFRKEGFLGIDNMEAAEYQGMTEHDKYWVLQWNLNKGIPMPDNSIDEILISHFIEHVKSPTFLLYECIRVCKNGAHIEVYVPLHEMESVGHLTEFDENWFEKTFLEEFPGRFSITHKAIRKNKPVDLKVPRCEVPAHQRATDMDYHVVPRTFDELNIIFKVIK